MQYKSKSFYFDHFMVTAKTMSQSARSKWNISDRVPMGESYQTLVLPEELDITADDLWDYALYETMDVPPPSDLMRKISQLAGHLRFNPGARKLPNR